MEPIERLQQHLKNTIDNNIETMRNTEPTSVEYITAFLIIQSLNNAFQYLEHIKGTGEIDKFIERWM